MNTICLTGRFVRTPELKFTQKDNTPVVTFTIAVDRPNTKDITDYFDCVAWKTRAEFVTKYFQKGDGIEVSGYLTTRTYENKKGEKRKAYEIICNDVSFPKGRKSPNENTSSESNEDDFTEVEESEDLPF